MLVEEQVETKLKEWGTSRGIRVPKSFCEYMCIDIGSELTMSAGSDEEGRFILLRVPDGGHRSFASTPMTSLDDLFAGYEGDYVPTEADWGDDAGAEVVA